MSDYIKREDVINTVSSLVRDEEGFVQEYAIDRIKRIPSADVAEVKHGHWDFQGLVDDIYAHGASCSVCGEYSEDNGYYCSCCGAKMDDALQRKTNPEVFKGGEEYE